MSNGNHLIGCRLGPAKPRETVSLFFYLRWKKILSVFVDESGDTGFENGASKYYVVSLVFHEQNNDISSQLNKFKSDPVFHVGPIIRKEDDYKNMNISERKRYLNKILILYSILPVLHKEFEYKKKEFDENKAKTLLRLAKDIHTFLLLHKEYFSSFDLINIYYDKGQQIVYSALAQAFGNSGLNVEFKAGVKNNSYRLAQVADYITSIKLTEMKMVNGGLSNSEEKFFENKKVFKRVYLRSLKKKEFK